MSEETTPARARTRAHSKRDALGGPPPGKEIINYIYYYYYYNYYYDCYYFC